MKPWPEVLPEILSRAPSCRNYADLIAVAESARGVPVTQDALLSAWKRHRGADWPLTPSDAMGGEFVADWDDDTIPGLENALVPRPRMTLIPGDIHFPIHDRHALDAMMAWVRDHKPNHLALQGDTYDFHAASRFPTEPERLARDWMLVDELHSGAEYIAEFDRVFERVDYIEGNHEGKRRWELIQENPWLYQHASVSPESMLQLPSRWTIHPWRSQLYVDGVCICHGDRLKGIGRRYSAAAALENASLDMDGIQTLIFGHTHRIDVARRVKYDWQGEPVTYSAMSVGHLSKRKEHDGYSRQPNWAHGFGVVEWHSDGGHSAYVIEIKNGRFSFGGREYGRPWQ